MKREMHILFVIFIFHIARTSMQPIWFYCTYDLEDNTIRMNHPNGEKIGLVSEDRDTCI